MAETVETTLDACLALIANTIRQLGGKKKPLNSFESRTVDGHTRTLLEVIKARAAGGGKAKDLSLEELLAAARKIPGLRDRGKVGDDDD